MKVDFYKKAKVEQVMSLCEVEEKAWASPGENISASKEKLLARIAQEGETMSTVLAVADGKAAGSQYAFRFNWDGNIENLESWDEYTCEGWTNKVHQNDGHTGFLVGVGVVPEFRGIKIEHQFRWPGKYKISELLIAITLDNLFGIGETQGVDLVIANARIPFYHKKPELSVEEYCALNREDGAPFDPVLRFHKKMGAQIIKPVAFSMEDAESLDGGCWVQYNHSFQGF